ncbi:hypothetical protein E4U55_003046 [Claviceps digitariae]|nr:hypothetical protein E4U55_003046 [Claviceps digitariae]
MAHDVTARQIRFLHSQQGAAPRAKINVSREEISPINKSAICPAPGKLSQARGLGSTERC